MYCPSDHVVCPLYDDIEDVAGLQIAISEESFTNNVLDWELLGYTKWNTIVDGENVSFWTLPQYFVSEESLKKSKEERLASRNSSLVLQENAVWLTGTNKRLLKLPDSESGIADLNFKKQACRPWMGTHYYYNMSSTTPCDEENMFSWFPIATEGKLIATGFSVFGNLPVGSPDWFERADGDFVRGTIPRGPQCVYDLGDSPGTLTMHVYYTDSPWLISCSDSDNSL